ncbi:RNA 2'-phosphotransferase [Desulfosudis oleivorans]|uniref:Phosphotransferase KptA/Tpt1 n=1 Tax=Desulfosudis oleivorans (strain DSM 6200 / JCM 39069 / Hxd3) TaxID=96561 RepID=A8ZZU8_DESOH|nr:RNA 2'-phosphotransferase [Desulfosudis oleivorans]ABW67348.1 phosphotransferase KptA/Tpt1 [Desulfosudis oleivorans Hxd3]
MANQKENKKLARVIAYMLGQAPAEFGLVPDASGYVKIKELIKALHEEEGWRHVRASMLNTLVLTLDDVPFEIQDDKIRTKDQTPGAPAEPVSGLPKLLYTCVRQRAHGRVAQAGITPSFAEAVVLSPDREMAQRIGKRRDPDPVVLVVETRAALENGVAFRQTEGDLFLADFIPVGCFTGPPVAPPRPSKPRPEPAEAPLPGTQTRAGTFFPAPDENYGTAKPGRPKGRKKDIEWKKARKHSRKNKENGWAEN